MLTVRLFGNAPIEVIGQTRDFPTGEADGEPLAEFDGATSSEALGPGQNVLVRSYVNARQLVEEDIAPVLYANASAFAALPIKLRVRSCARGIQNQTLIDVGRQIVMPGNVGVSVVAPSTFVDRRPADIESITEYFVQVVVCPVTCCYPPLPQLTFWRAYLAGADEDDRTFVVPRGARRMAIGEVPSGVVEATFWHQNTPISTVLIFQGDVVELFGAPDAVTFGPGTTAPGNILLRWEIEG